VFGRWGDRYHNDSYLNYLSDEDVLLEKGRLRLRAEQRSVEGDNPPGAYDYSSGMVSSHDKFSFLYGYIEIRAKFPGGPWCKEGDFVLVRTYSGTRFKIYGKEFRVINDDMIEAVVQDPRGLTRA
jgi:hypothetical protein